MLKRIQKIDDVKRFDICSNAITYTINNCLFLAGLKGDKAINYTDDSDITMQPHIYDDGFCCANLANARMIAFTNNKFQVFDLTLTAPCYSPIDKALFIRLQESAKKYVAKILIDNDKTKWKIEHPFFSLSHETADIFFYRPQLTRLTALNNQTGEELWTYTLPASFDYIDFTSKELKGKIVKILGVYKNNVWLLVNNGALLALDSRTGNQTTHILIPSFTEGFDSERQQNIISNIKNKNYGIFNNSSDNVQLDTDTGIIFGFPFQNYAEIDLNDPNYPFTLWDIQETLSAQKEGEKLGFDSLKIGSWEKYDVYVYDSFFDSSCFGVFDRATREIRWSEYFEGENEGWGAIQDLKYSSGYLYIHAQVDKSLHIYKLEK